MGRSLPNIIICGTPGTGKSTHATDLVARCPHELQHVEVGKLVKTLGLHHGFDEHWQTYDVDEDRLLDELEPMLDAGGVVLDWHACEPIPERLADLVVVLRTEHSKLWARLEARNYPLHKIQENNTAEIMQTVLDEAREAFAKEIVIELQSDSPEDVEANVDRILAWIESWRADRSAESSDAEGPSPSGNSL